MSFTLREIIGGGEVYRGKRENEFYFKGKYLGEQGNMSLILRENIGGLRFIGEHRKMSFTLKENIWGEVYQVFVNRVQ